MNIFGIYSDRFQFPIVELLHKDYDNRSHENHIEIARRFFHAAERRYACILLCYDGGSVAYTF